MVLTVPRLEQLARVVSRGVLEHPLDNHLPDALLQKMKFFRRDIVDDIKWLWQSVNGCVGLNTLQIVARSAQVSSYIKGTLQGLFNILLIY